MDIKTFYRKLANQDQTLADLGAYLDQFKQWIEQNKIASAEANYCLDHISSILQPKSLTVSLAGEFSRGKTELLNALLSSSRRGIQLPSGLGPTTACATEIACDLNFPINTLRLLPIETRLTKTPLNNFKQVHKHWQQKDFDPNKPKSVAKALSHLEQIKPVTVKQARAMGFDPTQLTPCEEYPGLLEIPAWRYAMINIDHPLLKQGLCLLDTPGLNAIGCEPVLTLQTLPHSDCVLFLLAADAGLTRTDLRLWQDYLAPLQQQQTCEMVVLLNKVDSLGQDHEKQLDKLRRQTAHQLSLSKDKVLPLSAKLANKGRATGDRTLLKQSHIETLELQLMQLLWQAKRKLTQDPVFKEIGNIVEQTSQQLKERLFTSDSEMENLQKLQTEAKQNKALDALRQEIKTQHRESHQLALKLKACQQQLEKHRRHILSFIDEERIQQLVSTELDQLSHPELWRDTAQRLTKQLYACVDSVIKASEKADRTLENILNQWVPQTIIEDTVAPVTDAEAASQDYATDNREYIKRLLDFKPYRRRLAGLVFRISQFFDTQKRVASELDLNRYSLVVSAECQHLFQDMRAQLQHWSCESLASPTHQCNVQKQLLDQLLLNLTQLKNDRTDHQPKIDQLRKHIAQQEDSLATLNEISSALIPLLRQISDEARPPINIASKVAEKKVAEKNAEEPLVEQPTVSDTEAKITLPIKYRQT